MRIIAIGFQKGVGRRSAADFLSTQLRVKNPGLKVKIVSFDGIIKKWAHEIFGIRRPIYYENHPDEFVKKSNGITPKEICFKLESYLLAIDPDVLINKIKKKNCDIKIISDATELISGAFNISITYPVIGADYHIKNTGTLKDLMLSIERLSNEIQTTS